MADVNPEKVKAVWYSMSKPSARKVAAQLKAAGFHIDKDTILKWKRQGWQRRSEEQNDTPIEKATLRIEKAVPLLTGRPETSLADLIPKALQPSVLGIYDADRSTLDEMSDLQLVREANRRGALMFSLIAREIELQRATLVAEKPEELATLLKAQAALLEAANDGFDSFTIMNDRLMKSVPTEDETDPLDTEMSKWGAMPEPERDEITAR